MRTIIQYWKEAEVIKKFDNRGIHVDELNWTYVEHDIKVSIGIAGYCLRANTQGLGQVNIYGLHDGKRKAHVVDGNYFDE